MSQVQRMLVGGIGHGLCVNVEETEQFIIVCVPVEVRGNPNVFHPNGIARLAPPRIEHRYDEYDVEMPRQEHMYVFTHSGECRCGEPPYRPTTMDILDALVGALRHGRLELPPVLARSEAVG